MTVLYRESDGQPVRPSAAEELGAGGQARVLAVEGNPAWVAKLYHEPAEAQARKLRVMLANPPAVGRATGDSADAAGRPALVWPADLLRDGQGRTVGLLMRRVSGMQRVFELYNPATRRVKSPHFDYAHLHRTARNVAAAFAALHAAGYVVGDVNESNVLVDEDGAVTLIDTDSFQVRDPASGEVFGCPVGRPEFAPPELQGRALGEVDRTPEHDRFALGVLVFQLLMEGTHPFAGQLLGPGDPPPIPERIARGLYPYTPGGEARPPRNAPPADLLHPLLRGAFRRCFEVGHADPSARPAAHEWVAALETAEAALVACASNRFHRYGRHLPACPWCERALALGGRDPFPTREAVARGDHLKAPTRRRVAAPAFASRRQRFAALGGVGFVSPDVESALVAGGALVLWVLFLTQVSGVLWFLVLPLAFTNVRKRMNGSPAAAVGTIAAGLLAAAVWLAHVYATLGVPTPATAGETRESITYAAPTAVVPSSRVVYESSELTRQPLPLQPDTLAAAVRSLRSVAMAANSSDAVTFAHLVVGADGLVEHGSVRFGLMHPDPAGLARAESMVERVPFRPAQIGATQVRTEVTVPVVWHGNSSRLLVESATWADAGFVRANPALAAPPHPPSAAPSGRPLTPTDPQAFRRALERAYPPYDRDAGSGARVALRFLVDGDGRVMSGSVHAHTTGDRRFAAAAALALDSLSFVPPAGPRKPAYPRWMSGEAAFDAAGVRPLLPRRISPEGRPPASVDGAEPGDVRLAHAMPSLLDPHVTVGFRFQ